MTDFYLTRMGRVFYEHTAPELVRQLELLNRQLERLIDTQKPQSRPICLSSSCVGLPDEPCMSSADFVGLRNLARAILDPSVL